MDDKVEKVKTDSGSYGLKKDESTLGKLKLRLKKFFFPIDLTCNLCGREIFSGLFCAECESTLVFNDGVICDHCGRRIFNAEERCFSCNGRDTYFERARSAFVYADGVKKLITALKYEGKRYLAEILAKYLADKYYSSFFNSELVVYPPMSEERLLERGYNQAELICDEFSRLTGIPVGRSVFLKTKETKRQATLDAEERRNNLRGSFTLIDKASVKGKRVLIIDDVMTTGATTETLSRLLVKAGASVVHVLTVASVAKGIEGKAFK